MFDLINRPLSFMGYLLEPDPNQDGATDMISNNSSSAALATFQSGELFGLSVKLLNFPPQAARLLHSLGVVLSQVVGDDIIRALGRQLHPEQFHFVVFGKTLEIHHFAMPSFCLRPLQSIHSPIRLGCARIIHLAVVFERAIIGLFQALDEQQDVLGRIPTIHQDEPEQKVLLIDAICQHVMHMVQLGLAIAFGIINSIVNDPESIQRGVDIHTGHDPNSFDDLMRIAAPNPS